MLNLWDILIRDWFCPHSISDILQNGQREELPQALVLIIKLMVMKGNTLYLIIVQDKGHIKLNCGIRPRSGLSAQLQNRIKGLIQGGALGHVEDHGHGILTVARTS